MIVIPAFLLMIFGIIQVGFLRAGIDKINDLIYCVRSYLKRFRAHFASLDFNSAVYFALCEACGFMVP
jgi:hypothetical protein